MTEPHPGNFERDGHLDKPAIVGARWWQQGLETPVADPIGRRKAMFVLLGMGAALTALGSMVAAVAVVTRDDDGPAPTEGKKPMLELQREFGWDFSARGEALVFDGIAETAWDESALGRMATDLQPGDPARIPFYVPTLFQSPSAVPAKTSEVDGATTFVPLSRSVRPFRTPAMDEAFARGRALGALLSAHVGDVALVIDLPGPESVAFAAGLAGIFDPVFLFDNWPHPRGAVRAHRTLSAAAYYQPLFVKRKARGRPPAFVLDRDRLAPVDEKLMFDNRWIATLPSAAQMKRIEPRVLYVTPRATDARELDDLNDEFVAYQAAGIDVRMVGADAFGPTGGEGSKLAGEPSAPPAYAYGGSTAAQAHFWADYPYWLGAPAPDAKAAPPVARAARDWQPTPRVSPYSSGAPTPPTNPVRPPSFGTVPVMLAVGTGLVLGWRHHRNGTWNRVGSSGGWGGG